MVVISRGMAVAIVVACRVCYKAIVVAVFFFETRMTV